MLVIFKLRMDIKRKTSAPKSEKKRESVSKPRDKKSASPALRESKRKLNAQSSNINLAGIRKKTGQQLVKKKIQDMKTPEIIIKVNYKGKRISIPIATCDDKNLHDTVIPHIVRFEHEILRTSCSNQIILISLQVASLTGRLAVVGTS